MTVVISTKLICFGKKISIEFIEKLVFRPSIDNGATSVRKFGYLCIEEILVLRKSSVSTSQRPPIRVSRSKILHFKHPHVSAVNRIPTKTTKPSLSFDQILMSTLTWITEKDLEREIKTKATSFVGRKHMKIVMIARVRK